MTVEQADALLDWIDGYERAQAEAHEKMNRGC